MNRLLSKILNVLVKILQFANQDTWQSSCEKLVNSH